MDGGEKGVRWRGGRSEMEGRMEGRKERKSEGEGRKE